MLVAIAAIGAAVVVVAPRGLGQNAAATAPSAPSAPRATPSSGAPVALSSTPGPTPWPAPSVVATAAPRTPAVRPSMTPASTTAPSGAPRPVPTAPPLPSPPPPPPLEGGIWDTGFENGSGLLAWEATYDPGGGTIVPAIECAPAAVAPHSGSCYLEVTTTAPSSSVAARVPHPPLAGQRYRMTMWLRCHAAASAVVVVTFEDRYGAAGASAQAANSGPLTLDGAWRQVTLTLTAAVNGSFLEAQLFLNPGAGIDMDDVSFAGPF